MAPAEARVIESNAASAFEALLAQIEQQAVTLAEARRDAAGLARSGDPARWRRAELLWPTFVKGR
jgi:hypothetical protein